MPPKGLATRAARRLRLTAIIPPFWNAIKIIRPEEGCEIVTVTIKTSVHPVASFMGSGVSKGYQPRRPAALRSRQAKWQN